MNKFMKNNLKVFIAIVANTVIVSSISVYATSKFLAKEIAFTPSNEKFKKENGETIENVEEALNELYNNSNKKIIGIGDTVKINYYNGTRKIYDSNMNLKTGTYICNANYSNSADNVSGNSFGTSGQTLSISGCDTYNELNKYSNWQSASSITSSSYKSIVMLGKIFTCNVNVDKNISFSYGYSDNISGYPIAFEASCTKIDYE